MTLTHRSLVIGLLALSLLAATAIILQSSPASATDYPPPVGFTQMNVDMGGGDIHAGVCRKFESVSVNVEGTGLYASMLDMPDSWNVTYLHGINWYANYDFKDWFMYWQIPNGTGGKEFKFADEPEHGYYGINTALYDRGYVAGHTSIMDVGIRWFASYAEADAHPFTFYLCYPNSYSLPTPTPAAAATDLPQGALPCITATVAATPTLQATVTPYGRGTSTPAPTRTPGGPSPTPTATRAISVSSASYDSGLLTFDSNVSALAAVGNVNSPDYTYKFLRWDPIIGNDGHAGAVAFHTFGGPGGTEPLTATTLSAVGSGLIAFYKPGGGNFTGPVAVSAYAKAGYTIKTGGAHFMRVWYLDPNYDGHGTAAWFSAWEQYVFGSDILGPKVGGWQLSNSWRKFGAVISPTTGSGQIAAIAFDDYVAFTMMDSGVWPEAPCVDYGCAYLDDLRISYGDAARLVLPICAGSTSGTTHTGIPTVATHVCVINYTDKNMFTPCVAPTSIDLGAWVSYLWCNLVRFFGFYPENTEQVNLIVERQSLVEPLGSISEMQGVMASVNANVDMLKSRNTIQVQTPIDFVAAVTDGSGLNWSRIASFTVPNVSGAADYMAGCSQDIINLNDSIASGACMGIFLMKTTVVVGFLQWGLNALFVVGIILMIRGDLEKLAS